MLVQAREGLYQDLSTGSQGVATPLSIPVVKTWPIIINPPVALILPARGGSYVTSGSGVPFGWFEVSLEVWLLITKKTPAEREQEELDLLVEQVLLNTYDWAVQGVAPTTLTQVSSGEYPTTIISLSKQFRL